MKKITMKDVAREAGVSVATVSYIINNRKDQKISPETRNKVLQIINLLNYTPNQSAKSLVTKKSQIVALYYKESYSYLKNAEYLHLISSLTNFLYKKNYHLICLSESNVEKIDLADVILTMDVNKDIFYKIGNRNFSPLIALDSYVDDPLFFQINTDFNRIKEAALEYFQGKDFTFLSLPVEDIKRRETLINIFPTLTFIEKIEDISPNKQKNVLIVDSVLNEIIPESNSKLYIPSITDEKFENLFQAIEWASQRIEIKNHNIVV